MPVKNQVFEKRLIVPFDQDLIKKYRFSSRENKIEINEQLLRSVQRYLKRLNMSRVEQIYNYCELCYDMSQKGVRAGPRARYLQAKRAFDLLATKLPNRSFTLYRARKLVQPLIVHPGNRWPIIRDKDGCVYPARRGQFILTDDNRWMQVEDGSDDLRKINARPSRDRVYQCSPVFCPEEDSYLHDVMAEQIEKVSNHDPRYHVPKTLCDYPDPSGFSGYEEIPAIRVVQIVNKLPNRVEGGNLVLTNPHCLTVKSINDNDPDDDLDNNYL